MKFRMTSNRWLLIALGAIGLLLFAGKYRSIQASDASFANQPEPSESVSSVIATSREYRATTTTIGTVLAMRSVTLRNELPGTVRRVGLQPGVVVEPGALLIALDVAVEQAELKALQAHAALARTSLARLERLRAANATSQLEVDRARAELDVALANIMRVRAIIARKTIRAPFRARVGIADVHPGQYLSEGSELTTLQSVDDQLHVDFMVPQAVAASLREGETVKVFVTDVPRPLAATIAALDARVNPQTRNTTVRATIARAADAPAPGASVRVSIGAGPSRLAVAIPASALRKGPEGDHVYVLARDASGKSRAQLRSVAVGALLGDEVLIESGLEPGEQVAAVGSFKLRHNALVAISEARSQGPTVLANR